MKSCRKQDFDFVLKTFIAHRQDETFEDFTLTYRGRHKASETLSMAIGGSVAYW